MEKHNVWALYCADEALFLHDEIVGIDEKGSGDLSKTERGEDIRRRFAAAHPNVESLEGVAVPNALIRLRLEMKTGDHVVCFAAKGEEIALGEVTGQYRYDAAARFPHRRSVRWLRRLSRKDLSRGALREISRSASPLFSVEKYSAELLAFLGIRLPAPMPEPVLAAAVHPEEAPAPAPAAASKAPVSDAGAFVAGVLREGGGCVDFRRLSAGLLLAMGYQVTQLAYGDADMVADRDELFSRILVKAAPGEVTVEDVRKLKNALRGGESGLLLSPCEISGQVAAAAVPGLRIVGGTELSELVLRYYDRLEERCRRMIPLRAVYIPA